MEQSPAETAETTSAESLYATPNALARHYRRFHVGDRLLLTGHSHQAWPDRAFEGQRAAWDDAASLVDGKWERAAEKAERVRRGYARLMGDANGEYALAESVHTLLVRLLSALPLTGRRRIVTTDGEFHSARRQLARLAEEGIELVRVAALPAESVGERLAAEVDDRTAAVICSTVFFHSAHIAGGLDRAMERCDRYGAALILDAYHQLNVVPMSLPESGLERAYILGGGYKYMQLGEGNCCLRTPPGCDLRPAITGWFAEFESLQETTDPATVGYPAGASRFAGSTYDPTSHYRAAEVLDFFVEMGLDDRLLRRVSQHQIAVLRQAFDRLDLDPRSIRRERDIELDRLGGFLALTAANAVQLCHRLKREGVHTDARGEVLRFGPAPYLSDAQLRDSMQALGAVVGRG